MVILEQTQKNKVVSFNTKQIWWKLNIISLNKLIDKIKNYLIYMYMLNRLVITVD